MECHGLPALRDIWGDGLRAGGGSWGRVSPGVRLWSQCLPGPHPALFWVLATSSDVRQSLGKMAGDQNEGQLANSWITHLFTLLVPRLIMLHQGRVYYHLKVPVKPPVPGRKYETWEVEGHLTPCPSPFINRDDCNREEVNILEWKPKARLPAILRMPVVLSPWGFLQVVDWVVVIVTHAQLQLKGFLEIPTGWCYQATLESYLCRKWFHLFS